MREEPPADGSRGITDSYDAAPLFAVIRDLQQEAFAVLALDGANKPRVPAKIITLGLLNQNQVHPREVFAAAVADRAAAIIVAHNHPSGTLDPSGEDIALTKRLVKAGEILGIPVLDHIILTATSHRSLKQAGVM
ncbi:JAB domain-containing protein [Candidatus Bipolaricaulota bacterium]